MTKLCYPTPLAFSVLSLFFIKAVAANAYENHREISPITQQERNIAISQGQKEVGEDRFLALLNSMSVFLSSGPVKPDSATGSESGVIFQQEFSHRPDGAYSVEDMLEDFPSQVCVSCMRVDLDALEIQNGEMKITFTEGKIGSGLNFVTDLKKEYSELFLSFDVRFDQNYDQVARGGKLMGLGGAPLINLAKKVPTGCVNVAPDEGFSTRFMYMSGGEFRDYIYHQDKTEQCGDFTYIKDPLGGFFYFLKDRTYTIEMHTVMNTPYVADGYMETYIDGRFMNKSEGYIFSQSGDYGISRFLFDLYIGGKEAQWELANPSTLYLDNFYISTERLSPK